MAIPEEPTRPVDLNADPITKELGTTKGAPGGCASLKGYLGAGAEPEVCRIYLDNSFWTWLEVKKEDIKYRVETPSNERDSRDEFWIARGARVITCQVSVVDEIQSELSGAKDEDPAYFRRPPW